MPARQYGARAEALERGGSPPLSRSAPGPRSIFTEWVELAARAFGDEAASVKVLPPLDAFIEGIKIVDDIQDEEPSCLATEVGVDRAMEIASAAFARGLELIAAMPLEGDRWRAAARSLGRGLRETAIGQELDASDPRDFDDFWRIVDQKTVPLAATALEIGALAAGASPEDAAALTKLALPLGRLLQISDDCLDALSPNASDWRAPRHNLLMLFALSGPNGAEIEALLTAESLPAAQRALLRDGALAYALHAQTATLAELDRVLASLALPDPRPFRDAAARQRAATENLLRLSGAQP